MGLVQKDAFRTMVISYLGILLGYVNKAVLFLIILTTEQMGLINMLISVGLLFAQFANFGATFSIWKFLPFFKNTERRHHGFFPFILLIVLAGTAITAIISLVFRAQIEEMYRERSPMFSDYFIWMLPIGIAYVLFSVFESYLRSFYHNIISVIAFEIVLRIAVTITLFLLWFNWIDFEMFVILNSLSYLIPSLILLLYINNMKEMNFSLKSITISSRFRKIIFQFSSFYYINALGIVLVNSMDMLMIGQMLDEGLAKAGVYSFVVFVASALQVPYKSVIRISSPMVADYWKQRDFDKMQDLYRKVSSVSLVIGYGAFVIIWVNIEFFFSFLKPEFQSGIWVFFFLMIGRLVDMYFGLNGSIFTTSKKYRYDLFFTLFLIGAVFIMNYLMIPHWGIAGAAISTSIALIIYNIGRIVFVWYVYKIHPFERNQFVIIGLGIAALAVNAFIPDLQINKWLQFVIDSLIAAVVFFLPILLFRLEPETIGYFQKGWKFIREKLEKSPPTELP